MNIYSDIQSKIKAGKKMLAVLIDPDKIGEDEILSEFLVQCKNARVDFLFLGGSILIEGNIDSAIRKIKSKSDLPILIFPGDVMQVHPMADAILFLSLISGRNAELLIGKQVSAAPRIKKSGLECISTGYLLIDCGNSTTVSYISQTLPIPYDKPEIASITAMTGEMLGLKMIYTDGGSGAKNPISKEMIREIKNQITIPLIIGGGIKNMAHATIAWEAGADIVVIGTAFEKNQSLIFEFSNRQ